MEAAADADADPNAAPPSALCWAGCISALRIGCCCLLNRPVYPEAQSQFDAQRSSVARPRWDASVELVGLTLEPNSRAAGKGAMQRTTSLVIGGAPLRQQIARSSSSPPEHKTWNSVRDEILGLASNCCGGHACSHLHIELLPQTAQRQLLPGATDALWRQREDTETLCKHKQRLRQRAPRRSMGPFCLRLALPQADDVCQHASCGPCSITSPAALARLSVFEFRCI